MERGPGSLHRVAAWCVAALAFAAVLVGTRGAYRALRPEARGESEREPRATTDPVDIAGEPASTARAAEREADEDVVGAPRGRAAGRRPVGLEQEGPLEKQPFHVFAGHVHSRAGRVGGSLDMDVLHPGGGSAVTRLFFERDAPDGRGTLAPFRLIKPAPGAYVLRPRLGTPFEYEVRPTEWRVEASTDGIVFEVFDDVQHVDLDLVALDAKGGEIPRASFRWAVHDGEDPARLAFEFRVRARSLGREVELAGVPATNALSLMVWAPGHRPQFRVVTPDAERPRVEFRLERGWGLLLEDRAHRSWLASSGQARVLPLGQVVVDGTTFGWTDPSGRTWIEGDEEPRSVEVWFGGRRARTLRGYLPGQLALVYDHDATEPAAGD